VLPRSRTRAIKVFGTRLQAICNHPYINVAFGRVHPELAGQTFRRRPGLPRARVNAGIALWYGDKAGMGHLKAKAIQLSVC
jgi:hypothetical protein